MYAGDMTNENGTITDVTNLSGTFEFDDPMGLMQVARQLQQLGFEVAPTAIRFLPPDGSRPVIWEIDENGPIGTE
jgi:hypothetical protein